MYMAPLMKLLFTFLRGLALAFKSSSHKLVIDHFIPTASPSPTNCGYDCFKLALQWPPTVNPRSKLGEFTIHGLWPERYDKKDLKNCYGPAFVPMPAQEALLHKSWPDVRKGDDTNFWKREWNVHGKCSFNGFNQTEYFRRADELRAQYNVIKYLSGDNIKPGNKAYRLQWIENAVKNRINNFAIQIRCNIEAQQLWEIRICFKADGKTPTNCPGSVYGECGGANNTVYFPSPRKLKKQNLLP